MAEYQKVNRGGVIILSSGYELFIDYLKAYCILWVVFCHLFPYLDLIGYSFLGAVQVPIFLLIQAFHFYKNDNTPLNVNKLIKRILLPFFTVQLLYVAVLINKEGVEGLLLHFLYSGGGGPGSYYPWIYVQFALFCLLLRPFLQNKLSSLLKCVIILLASVVFEACMSPFISPELFRLLAYRYLFLVYLGWIWARYGIVLNKLTISFSFMSLLIIIILTYTDLDLGPFIKYGNIWTPHTWSCYCWPAFLYVALLFAIYKKLSNYRNINNIVQVLSKATYEIFLLQMVFIAIIPNNIFKPLVEYTYIYYPLYLLLIFIASVGGGILWNKTK